MTKIRWGILGTGAIAHRLAEVLQTLPDAELCAVGSRSQASAEVFAQRFGVTRAHGNYAGAIHDADVDIIYVATPHVFHHDQTRAALQAGKAVLCEKPFAMTHAEAAAMVADARNRGLFLMEAMWSRFFPVLQDLRQRIQAGAIGEPRLLQADFGFRDDRPQDGRLFDPALGGGALLDVGVYPLSLSSLIFGAPVEVAALAHRGPTGVDEQTGMVLRHARGELSLLACAMRTRTPWQASIAGSAGLARITPPFWRPTGFTLERPDQPDETFEVNPTGSGYQHECLEVMRCLRGGLLESPLLPLDETLAVMKTLDQLRACLNLRYPSDAG